MPIRVTDLNYAGHLANDKVLTLSHEARERFFRHFGYSEMNIEGDSLIMADAAVQYKSEGFLGDVLIVQMAIPQFTRVGFDMIYQMSKEESGQVVAMIKTALVFFDYEQKKLVSVPEKFKALFA